MKKTLGEIGLGVMTGMALALIIFASFSLGRTEGYRDGQYEGRIEGRRAYQERIEEELVDKVGDYCTWYGIDGYQVSYTVDKYERNY